MTASAGNATGVDLGSLKLFVTDRRKFKDVVWTAEQEKLEKEKEEALKVKKAADVLNRSKAARAAGLDDEMDIVAPPRPQTVPASKKYGGPRRIVSRMGDNLNMKRVASPRNMQLTKMLPGNEGDAWQLAWARTLNSTDWRMRTGRSVGHSTSSRPITAPVQPIVDEPLSQTQKSRSFEPTGLDLRKPDKAVVAPTGEPKTGFTVAMFSGTADVKKPRAEVHPLLTAIEGMQHDDIVQHGVGESGLLSQRLDELRWGELRKGAWTNRPERRRPAEKDATTAAKQQERGKDSGVLEAPGRQLVSADIARSAKDAGIKDIHGDSEQMERLIHIMDPERTGVVAPEVFVPLFFWLGLTRRRTAVLITLELAFGPGNIDVGGIQKLSRYAEVQIRLIEGLRHLARRESLEQLCEYITDMMRLRTWFHTMKRDTTGHADIVEVQNLFARMEVTSDRQTLFRFLTHIIHSEVLPSATAERGEKQGAIGKRTFGIGDFASLLCRCAVAWCLHRTLMLIDPSDDAERAGDGPLMAPNINDLDREAEMRWVALQRKIIISLLVNHRFWGRESRTVLMSLNQPQMTTLGNLLTPEQWLSLFQRVRAQGIASTLPVGDEASDPEWLFKKAISASGVTRRNQAEEGAAA